MEEVKEGTKLTRIDLEKGVFTANGKTYTIEGTLSVERYMELQILEKDMAYGFTVKGIFDKLKTIWELHNKMKFAEVAVELRDLMAGAMRVKEREPAILKICALFCNTPDEDRKTITSDRITEKLNDFKAEGIPMQDFFVLASNSVNGFLDVYREASRIISGTEAADRDPA